MATHRIPCLGWSSKPDDTGLVYFQPYSVLAVNDTWDSLVLVFEDDTVEHKLHGRFMAPQNYVGTAKFIAVWTANAISGNVKWQVAYRAVGGNDTESLDQTTAQETLTVVDAAPSAVHERLEASMTATAANFAAGDTVEFIFSRRTDDVADTMAASAIGFDLLFEYADA